MRSRHVLVIVALLTMTLAAPAKADPPERLLPPQPISYEFVTDTCDGFEVRVEGGGKQGLIFYADYVRLIAPGGWATLTNLATGESMTINNSGPGTQSVSANEFGGVTITLTGTGNWGHDHGYEFILTSGRFVATFVLDDEGNLMDFTEDHSRARVVDLCAALS
jgi:hypothetical protein